MLVWTPAFPSPPLADRFILRYIWPAKGRFMRHIIAAILTVLLAVSVGGSIAAAQELKTEEQKTLYALGLALSQNLALFNLTPAELELVKSGLADGALKKTPKV